MTEYSILKIPLKIVYTFFNKLNQIDDLDSLLLHQSSKSSDSRREKELIPFRSIWNPREQSKAIRSPLVGGGTRTLWYPSAKRDDRGTVNGLAKGKGSVLVQRDRMFAETMCGVRIEEQLE